MQMFNGEDHILTYKGLSYHLASEIIRTQNRSYLADLIFENTWMNPVMMFSALAIQPAVLNRVAAVLESPFCSNKVACRASDPCRSGDVVAVGFGKSIG